MGIMALIRRADGGSSRVRPAAWDTNAKSAQNVHCISSIAIGASKPKEDRTALLSKTIDVDTARWFGCSRRGGGGGGRGREGRTGGKGGETETSSVVERQALLFR